MSSTLAFFTFSPAELLVLGFIALLLFGKRLPEVMRSLGKGVTEFKKGMSGLEEEFNRNSYSPNQTQYHDPGRPLPLEERPELTAPKFQPPTTAPTAAPTVAPAMAPVAAAPEAGQPAPAPANPQPTNPA
jgi:sec-independent protein translocase protein TatA